MSYKVKVEAITGVMSGVTGYIADTSMDEWLQETAREIITVMPPIMKSEMTVGFTDSGSGVVIGVDSETGGGGIVYAHKSFYKAQRGLAADKARYASGSIYEPTATSPVYYVESGKAFMLPGGGTFEVLRIPIIVSSDDFGSYANATSVVPQAIEYLIVSGTAAKAKFLQMDSKRREMISAYSVVPLGEHPDLVFPPEPVLNFPELETFLDDEDSELLSARKEIMASQLEDFNTKLKSRTDKFNAEMQVYADKIDSLQKKVGID